MIGREVTRTRTRTALRTTLLYDCTIVLQYGYTAILPHCSTSQEREFIEREGGDPHMCGVDGSALLKPDAPRSDGVAGGGGGGSTDAFPCTPPHPHLLIHTVCTHAVPIPTQFTLLSFTPGEEGVCDCLPRSIWQKALARIAASKRLGDASTALVVLNLVLMCVAAPLYPSRTVVLMRSAIR